MAMNAAQAQGTGQAGQAIANGGGDQTQGQAQRKSQTTISLLQYFMVVIASITAFGHFVYVHLAMMYAGRDTWLSLTIGCAMGLVITYLSLWHVAKHPKLSLGPDERCIWPLAWWSHHVAVHRLFSVYRRIDLKTCGWLHDGHLPDDPVDCVCLQCTCNRSLGLYEGH
ncbi:hypothetical protein GCM10025858_21890 [Alicyclobacillus sacchari]|nr:hypothetical protein GCM10025858_21890 [Alicyclobacillus sacchari]